LQLWSVYLISSYCNRPIFVFLYVSLHYYEWRYHIHVCNFSFSFWLWMLLYYWHVHVKVSVVLYDEAGLCVCVCVCVCVWWCACTLLFATHIVVCMYVCMFFFSFTFICHVSRLQMQMVMDINSANIRINKHIHSRCNHICSLHPHTCMWMHMYAVVQHAVLLTEQIHINLTVLHASTSVEYLIWSICSALWSLSFTFVVVKVVVVFLIFTFCLYFF